MASGIVFPDLARSIGAAMQIKQGERRNALTERAFEREEEDRAREREAQQHVPAALAGDKSALSRIAATSPSTAFKLAPLLERMDASQRTKVKEAADWTTTAAMGVLSLPPEQRPAAYAAAIQEGKSRGFDLSAMPPQYGPDVESRLNFYVGKARDVNKWFDEQSNRPTPMGLPGGGAPPSAAPPSGAPPAVVPGDSQKTGQQYASYLTKTHGFSPTASAGIVGGLFQESGFNPNAVGDNGTAGGLGQWRLDRREGLARFAATQGKQASDPYVQLDYLVHEMRGGDLGAQRAYSMLQTAKTPEEATTAMMHFFRPQGYTPANPAAGHGYAQRVQYAQRFMDPQNNPVSMPQPPSGLAVPGTPAEMPGMPRGLAQGDNAPADGSGTPLPPAVDDQRRKVFELNDWLQSVMPGAVMYGNKKTGQPYYDSQGKLMVRKPDGSPGWVDVPKASDRKESGGPFSGNSLDAQSYNIVLQGDPSSPAYAAAYANLAAPKITVDAAGRPVTVTPNMSWARPPTFQNGGQATPGAPAAPTGQTTTQLPGGQSVTVVDTPTRATPKEIQDLRTARVEADTMLKALEDFKSEVAKASFGDSLKSMTGMPTALNTSFNVAALLAKGEQLFNLGVLNGPDLDIIRRTLPDPSTLRGGLASKDDINTSIDKVTSLIKSKLEAREKQVGIKPDATPKGTYLGPDNKPISWAEIETTARNRNISTDEVVRALGLKPTGMQ